MKVFSFFLAFYMMFLTVGISVKKHYCCGILKGLSVFVDYKGSCECTVGDLDGCCNQETDYISLEEDYFKLVVFIFEMDEFLSRITFLNTIEFRYPWRIETCYKTMVEPPPFLICYSNTSFLIRIGRLII